MNDQSDKIKVTHMKTTQEQHNERKKEIMEVCPDISTTTSEKALGDLMKRGTIIKTGGEAGRTTL